jgi:hypothetical protein
MADGHLGDDGGEDGHLGRVGQRREEQPTWSGIAGELERAGFGVAMLDPHGEVAPGIEAFLIKLSTKIRKELADDTEG